MELVQDAGKRTTGTRRGKKRNRCQERTNMELVHRKTYNWCKSNKTRENKQPVSKAEKHTIGTRRWKIGSRCQERENMELVQDTEKQLVQGAGKHTTGARRWKIGNRCQERETCLPLNNFYWSK